MVIPRLAILVLVTGDGNENNYAGNGIGHFFFISVLIRSCCIV
jgi:hypothetical protein